MGNSLQNPFSGSSQQVPNMVNVANPNAGGFQYSFSPIGGANTPSKGGNMLAPTWIGTGTPQLFDAQSKLPSSFSGNSPIYNPTSILNAYKQYLPNFMLGATPTNVYQNPQQIQEQQGMRTVNTPSPFEQMMGKIWQNSPANAMGMPQPQTPQF